MYYGVTAIMINYPIPIIILLVIPFFIMPVSASVFLNPSFETGDTSYWTEWHGGGSEITVVDTTSTHGNYSVYFSTAVGQAAYIRQIVDTTGHDNFSFDFNPAYSSSNYIQIKINGSTILNFGRLGSGWENKVVDISGYTGNKLVEIYQYHGVYAKTCYYDKFKIDGLMTESTINYNPDIAVSDTKPFNLSYTLSNIYSDNPLYPCFIYAWIGTDIGNETHPNIIWGYIYQGYVNQAEGYFMTSDYFHSYQWPDLNVSYGIALYNPDDITPGIRFDNIESDPNMLDYDQIYVHYNYSYPTPTPQPTPDMTAIPTPSGTPTPQPTATPQPNPESINESLNTSFKQGYSNLVNTTIDGFYEPVYNFTYYIASPLLGINDTLYNFSIHMNESFTNSSSSLILSSSILFMIMVNIPDKLINVMTYYLIWLIILLIFKGDA